MGKKVVFLRKNLDEQVTESLRESIEFGELSENSRIPNSRELANRYGVSHNVMLKAMKQLHHDDVICLPYEPLSRKENTISLLGKELLLGKNGLPEEYE